MLLHAVFVFAVVKILLLYCCCWCRMSGDWAATVSSAAAAAPAVFVLFCSADRLWCHLHSHPPAKAMHMQLLRCFAMLPLPLD
jgi:hypothetical protein